MKRSLLTLALVACASSPPAAPTKIAEPKASASTAIEVGGCPSHIDHATPIADALPPPSSWVVRDAPAPASETIECANLSSREWKITGKNGSIDISLRPRSDMGDELPFAFRPTKKDEAALHGAHHVHSARDGFLVGFDAGEYGGALYQFSQDGTKRKKLSNENVVGFADLRIGTIVVTGLAHLGMSVGHLLKISNDASGARADSWIDLGGAAETFVVESPESVLVLTTGGLFRITACGDVNQISRTNYDALYPNSMATDARGVLYVGMRQFVVRWLPTANGYREEWLTTGDCTMMVRDKFECRCRGGS